MITTIIKKLVNYNIFHAFQGKDNSKKKRLKENRSFLVKMLNKCLI